MHANSSSTRHIKIHGPARLKQRHSKKQARDANEHSLLAPCLFVDRVCGVLHEP